MNEWLKCSIKDIRSSLSVNSRKCYVHLIEHCNTSDEIQNKSIVFYKSKIIVLRYGFHKTELLCFKVFSIAVYKRVTICIFYIKLKTCFDLIDEQLLANAEVQNREYDKV